MGADPVFEAVVDRAQVQVVDLDGAEVAFDVGEAYQNGLLINYWDESFGDNNVGDHPGGGLILPVNSQPVTIASQAAAPMATTARTIGSTRTVMP